MIPPPPGSGPLDLNVNMASNRDIITPLSLGTINYVDPAEFSTTQITEILVLDTAIPFQRFAATAPFSLTGDSAAYPKLSEVFPGSDVEDASASGDYKATGPGASLKNWFDWPGTSSGPTEGVIYFDIWKDLWDRRVALKESSSLAGVWLDSQRQKVTSKWAAQDSLAFSPQIDVFSRFNKWFTSVTWMVPEGYSGPSSFTWPVLFIYADRVNKILYNVTGSISASTEGGGGGGGGEGQGSSLTLSGAVIFASFGISKRSIKLTGSAVLRHPTLSATVWKYEVSINDGPFDYSALSSDGTIPTTIDLGGSNFAVVPGQVYKVIVRVVSQDPAAITVTSNTIYVASQLS